MASHLGSFWKWDFLEFGNGLLHVTDQEDQQFNVIAQIMYKKTIK